MKIPVPILRLINPMMIALMRSPFHAAVSKDILAVTFTGLRSGRRFTMPHKPVMGRLPGWDNGYVAANFGGMGICLSPGAGQIMADLISDGEVAFRAKHLMEQLSVHSA